MADLTEAPAIVSVLREIRLDAGLSLGDLEALTHINRGRLSILERGVLPTRAELHRIMGAIWAERMRQLERVSLGQAAHYVNGRCGQCGHNQVDHYPGDAHCETCRICRAGDE